jgi:hypothetical protein
MKSFIAALRTLVLPFGATTGRRIVLDGINGVIQIYDSNNDLRLELGRLADSIDLYTGTVTNEDEPAHIATFGLNAGSADEQGGLRIESPQLVAPDNRISTIELLSEAADGAEQPSITLDTDTVDISGVGSGSGYSTRLRMLGNLTESAHLNVGGGTAFPDVDIEDGILQIETDGRINIGADPVPRANNVDGNAAHTKIQYGTVVVAVSAGAQTFTTAVVFDEAYDAAPVVVTGFNSTSGARAVEVEARSVTTTGFTATVRASAEVNFGGAANYTISWIAAGEIAP